MPRKENTKAKTWERDRRNRMNGYFKNLSELLPPQLEGRKRNKIDILIQASKYIKDLHNHTNESFHTQVSDVHKEELARLKRLVTLLITRTQLLSDLLKNAGIAVPAEPALDKITPLKWSNKINVVHGSKIINKVETYKRGEKKKERCNNNLKKNLKKKPIKTKKAEQPVRNKNFSEKLECIIENQENHVSGDDNQKLENNKKLISSNEESTSSNVSLETIPPKIDIKNHKKVKRKKKSVSKKIISKNSTDINNLPTGTLVFSGGKIMPVVTPMPSLTSNIIVNAQSQPSNSIILNNAQQSQMIVVQPLHSNQFQTVGAVQKMTLNAVPNIRTNMLINPQDWAKNVKTIINSSKIGGLKGILPKVREVTETTMTYKVPIPAIHKEKLDYKSEGKGIPVSEKNTKIANTLKTINTGHSSKMKVESDSKNSKEGTKTAQGIRNKSSVNKKQSMKRKLNMVLKAIVDTKKQKITLSESEIKSVQINADIVDNSEICESAQNLQVIEKSGEDISYSKMQLNTSAVNNLNSNSKKDVTENNLLLKSNNGTLNNDKCKEEKSNLFNEFVLDEKSEINNSNIIKLLPEKEECSILTVLDKPQEKISEKASEGVIENRKHHSPISSELVTEVQNDKENLLLDKTDIQLTSVECSIDENIILTNESSGTGNIDTRLNNIIQSSSQDEVIDEPVTADSNKIFLNLDTNTTTTMKLESSQHKINCVPPTSTSPSIKLSTEEESIKLKSNIKEDPSIIKTISYSPSNSFIPISNKTDSLHSDLSNDIFASLQVPSSSNNSESISPTAAFLMAFPIVSSLNGKTEVLDDEMKDDFKYNSQTPPMLLQIGAIEPNNFKINSRPSINDNLESVGISEIMNQSQVKTSVESITPINTSTSVTTSMKTLPRVISSQTLIESFKIIPASSEQINRQLNIETSNSLQEQTSPANGASINNASSVTGDESSIITDNIERSMNDTVHNNRNDNKPSSNFNYTKDMTLTSISNSMANDILNKYMSTTSLTTNSVTAESSIKYNITPQYGTQNCSTSISNYAKENINRSNTQYNFPIVSANDIPTERDLCKLQICPMEAFTERSNEYSNRNKENSFTTSSVQSTDSGASTKIIQVSVNQEKSFKVPIQNNQNVNSNNFQSIKKLENKEQFHNSETNVHYHKKVNEISDINTYIAQCENKINKKIMNVSSQSNNSGQKSIPSPRTSTFSQQTETYLASSNYEENSITRSTTTVANNTSNFSILSWTTFSPLSSNNSNFPQYDLNSVSNEIPKTICENLNYLSLPKENISLSNAISNSSYAAADSHISTYEKSKTKESLDSQKRSYNDMNKARNTSQTISMQKSSRNHNLPSISNADYKYSTETKNKYKYPMDMDYTQNNYSNSLETASHLQHSQQQNQQTQQNHQSTTTKTSPTQQIQSLKPDKPNYMVPDFDTQTNFNSDSNNIQGRYSNNHDAYSGACFKYSEKTQQIQSKYQSTSQLPTTDLHQDNSLYNTKNIQHHQVQSNQNKVKADSTNQIQPPQQQQPHQQNAMRPPVNWMMTPEIKHNSNITDIILPPIGKELEYCPNNIFSQTPSYNQNSANHQFYNNYEMTTHAFPNIPVLQSESKRNIDTTYYPEDQAFSWSPTKNASQISDNQSLKSVDTSTMPTLVVDLALGVNVTDKQNFLFGQMPIRSSTNDANKDSLKNKESNIVSRSHYEGIVNSQNSHQHLSHGMPFLSVSQLVDHEKAEKNHHQSTHNITNHNHHHHQPQQQQQQQSQPQAPRKQRKSNGSPRANGKRQLELRQKQSVHNSSEQIHRQHEESKTSSTSSSFSDTGYQQHQQQQPQAQQHQKYPQQNNDMQWRTRNCKSNYTAEALIGTTNSHTENNHTDKNLPKYTTNYTQNKFPNTLSSDPMSINYLPNVEDTGTGYGQVMNQNFNHSYSYSTNANIYPTSNFMTNITNSSTNYIMALHENTPDYLESNNFLLPPNVSTTSITTPLLSNMTDGAKNHHHHPHHHHHHQPYTSSKHQNCDKRLYFNQQKKSKRKTESSAGVVSVQNFDFPLSGISSPLDDYHHASTFLPPPNPLYQNQSNVYSKSALPPPPPPPPPVSSVPPSVTSATLPEVIVAAPSSVSGNQGIAAPSNQMGMSHHHPSGTSLTNFNLSTIFPEINDKVTGYKSSTNEITPGITQPISHTSTTYPQRTNYTDALDQISQTADSTAHFNNTGSRG